MHRSALAAATLIAAAALVTPTPAAVAGPTSSAEATCTAGWNGRITPHIRHEISSVHASRAVVSALSDFVVAPGTRPRSFPVCVVRLVGSHASVQLEANASATRPMLFRQTTAISRVLRIETNAVLDGRGALRLTGIFSS